MGQALVKNFSISEWNIQFKIPDTLSSLTYKIIDSDSVGLSLKNWEEIDSNCSAAKGAAGILERHGKNTGTSEIYELPYDNQLGNYNYRYTGPQSPCSKNEQILGEQTKAQPAINLRNSITTSLISL